MRIYHLILRYDATCVERGASGETLLVRGLRERQRFKVRV